MRKGRLGGIAALAGLLATGCASAQAAPAVSHGIAEKLPAVSARPLGTADTGFGLDVLHAWCQNDPRDNLVFSPSTLATALGMAYLGARGTTARAMANTLHLPAGALSGLEAGLQARTAGLAGLDGPGVTVSASNQIWADPSLVTLRAYLNALATSYAAGVERAPLTRDPDQAANEIDQAISTATHGQISRLISPDMLDGTGWVLTSALYLDAAWAVPFDPNQTWQGQFTTTAKAPVTANYMHQGGFRFGTSDGWTGVTIPYRGGKLSMVALLPPPTASGCAVPDTAALSAIGAGAADGDTADIALPKVSLSSSGSMNDLLKSLGMGVAFGDQADFSGLSPQACCIGFVQQAATLRVGEKGTVGAAAAAVGIVASSGIVASRQVDFDRPYLVLVTTSNGEPLFLARVANPAA